MLFCNLHFTSKWNKWKQPSNRPLPTIPFLRLTSLEPRMHPTKVTCLIMATWNLKFFFCLSFCSKTTVKRALFVKHVAAGTQHQLSTSDVFSGPDVENKKNRRARLATEKETVLTCEQEVWKLADRSKLASFISGYIKLQAKPIKRRIVSARPKKPTNAHQTVAWASVDPFAVQSAPGDDSAVLVVVHPLHQWQNRLNRRPRRLPIQPPPPKQWRRSHQPFLRSWKHKRNVYHLSKGEIVNCRMTS